MKKIIDLNQEQYCCINGGEACSCNVLYSAGIDASKELVRSATINFCSQLFGQSIFAKTFCASIGAAAGNLGSYHAKEQCKKFAYPKLDVCAKECCK